MDETLMAVVEEFAAFCKLNDADEIKPDVAEWGLMRIRDLLKELNDADRAVLVAFFESRIELSDGYYADFLRELPDALQLRSQ